jgi:predicted Holliday junction resolvase-like endonuclease
MVTVLWVIAIALAAIAYLLRQHLYEERRHVQQRHLRLEQILERAAKSLESMMQMQQDRRDAEVLYDDETDFVDETQEEKDRRWSSYQKK